MKKIINTHIKKEGIKVKYQIEYTEKDEAIDINFSNLKQAECKDFEELIKSMFQLRQMNKYNINLYFIIEDEDKKDWILEDSCNDTEVFAGNEIEKIKQKRIDSLEKCITDQEKELNLYREFIKKYNSEKYFEEYKKDISA